MQVKDIMTTSVVTARTGDTVAEVAKAMATKRISGLPVVDDGGKVIGVVSEGDLLARAALGQDTPRSWWLGLIGEGETPEAFMRAHGKTVGDVMTRSVKTIQPDASLAALARKLESCGVKRLPVVEGGKLVGVVSRADVVRALASIKPEAPAAAPSDAELRSLILSRFHKSQPLVGVQATIIVRDGVVELWGLAPNAKVVEAARVAAEAVDGVKRVENHLALFPTAYYG
ncbi:MAG: CBS domain-containing protein [Alphaproteobacteria bacterium]